MSKSVTKRVQNNVKVDLVFDPPVGPPASRRYMEMYHRCEGIHEILAPLKLDCISFNNPYTYGGRPVQRFSFEINEKTWLPPKKRKLLAKMLGSKKMKSLGLVDFRIRRVKQTVVTERIFEELT